MKPTDNDPTEALLPPASLAKVEAMAVVERYLHDLRPAIEPEAERPLRRRNPQEAGARMLARRQFHHLPEGVTIRELMTYGRA